MNRNVSAKLWPRGLALNSAIGLLSLLAAMGASAQVSGAASGNARYTLSAKPGSQRYGSVTLAPIAAFGSGGNFPNGTSGTSTDFGGLIGADFGVKPAGSRNAYEAGGWLWTTGSADLYQLHGRVYFTPEMGVQLAYLGSTKVSGSAYTAFLLYDILSARLDKTSARRWSIQAGLGAFIDPAGGRTTTSLSTFVQGSYALTKRVSLTASLWTVRDRSADLTRYVVGASYGF